MAGVPITSSMWSMNCQPLGQDWTFEETTRRLSWIVWTNKPDVVVSTGAAPVIALLLGRMMGARTIWLDGVADVEQLSLYWDMGSVNSPTCGSRSGHIWPAQTVLTTQDLRAMIFRVTVGTQGQFDRLIQTVDEIGGRAGQDGCIGAQEAGPSNYQARYIHAERFISPNEFREREKCHVTRNCPCGHGVYYHRAWTRKDEPSMPRLAALGEHRNDHQLDGEAVAEQGRIKHGLDQQELMEKLDRLEAFNEAEQFGRTGLTGSHRSD